MSKTWRYFNGSIFNRHISTGFWRLFLTLNGRRNYVENLLSRIQWLFNIVLTLWAHWVINTFNGIYYHLCYVFNFLTTNFIQTCRKMVVHMSSSLLIINSPQYSSQVSCVHFCIALIRGSFYPIYIWWINFFFTA